MLLTIIKKPNVFTSNVNDDIVDKQHAATDADTEANSDSNTTEYINEFVHIDIFETEYRMEKHRGKTISKLCVKSGWTSKLAIFLFKEIRVPCKFDFRKAWITNGVIHTKANCDCGSMLVVSCDLKIVRVSISKIRKDYNHKRKYQVSGSLKDKLDDLLSHKSAEAVRNIIVNENIPNNQELTEIFDPVTPGLNALRIQKFKQQKIGQDPVDAILDMMDSEFKDSILAVGHSPFYVFYRTELQLAWYKAESKKGPISIVFDATGSTVISPRRSQKIAGTDKLKYSFIYSLLAKTKTKSVPIAQMLSQDHTSEFIELFLRKMFKYLKPPFQITCDAAKALMKTLVKTFTNCHSLSEYVTKSMSALINGTKTPEVFLRIDVAHFIKNFTRKVKDSDYRRRNFFRGVVGYLMQCANFKIVKEIIHDFFTVILNKFDGCSNSKNLPSEESKRKLLRLISTHDEKTDYDATGDDVADMDFGVHVDYTWIIQIIDTVELTSADEGDLHDNIYYSPKDKNFYVKLFSTIPLWGNVMSGLYGSTTTTATSADVESSFKSLKNGILGHKMMRADTFLRTHIEAVNAAIKLNASSNDAKTTESNAPIRKRSNSMNETPTKRPRRRTNSNQYEYHDREPSETKYEEENGNK